MKLREFLKPLGKEGASASATFDTRLGDLSSKWGNIG